ncbi:acyl-CoA dehydrogenase family protein [Amycolatopsis pithecellobii]|uniref:Oxidoreductase n=1 Tax=Amycolatopsis pithecellobii TaxID=664692 RepID=A0A6N7Z4X2_9PSEU|nr:acyl-CoA dehydrogenase family protein [Amycolatopsis pithecellobii]MTD56539.1 oxidoreductase [Amycolatopsis pithecellobii]
MTQGLARPETGAGDSGDYVARARDIAPIINAEADGMEDLRGVSPAVVAALREQRIFWMLVPREWGGGGLGIVETFKVIEELARADGSTGWVMMANVSGTGVAAGYLGDAGARVLFAGPDKGIIAGMFLPVGRGVRVEGGYRVTGKYGFASGSGHASWMGAGFAVYDEDGNPETSVDGSPVHRLGFVPRDEVKFLGGWNVMGMVATGSDDYSVTEVFVPEARTMDTFSTTPVRSEAVYSLGLVAMAVGGHGPVALGIARRALEEVAHIAAVKTRPGYPSVIGDNDMFRREFATHEALLQAARRYVYEVCAEAEAQAAAGGVSDVQRARLRQAVTWVVGVARDIVNWAFNWGGSASIRNPSVLGRCLRDISVGATHMMVEPMTMVEAAGPILATYLED